MDQISNRIDCYETVSLVIIHNNYHLNEKFNKSNTKL